MSNDLPGTQSVRAEIELREYLGNDLMAFLDQDVHISGYIVQFIQRTIELELLERLVDELDSMYRVNGRSVIGRKA